ncbi:MAG: transglycosylase SLT domain-containing protein [Prevotella sp.]|nr:transglycosylase SLT domain-containing protein [Prevotella sp.]MDY6129936.1 transglycosylase SLT domain-containing protein [Prevotella sp.]
MKKKIILIVTAFILGGNCLMQAQNTTGDTIMTTNNGVENIVDVPEGMLLEVDSLLNLYNAKTYLKEENCNYRNVNPEFSQEIYMERLKRIPTIMEMPYNDIVRKFIDRYATQLRRSVSYMLGASNFYIPIFEEALEAYNLPLELKYLPVIESALTPSATSHAGAAGLWQFMITTGKQYGLEINSLIDERRDPVKSSYAAARYLKDLYKIYGDWNLVIAAYNCGPGAINKAMHRANGEKDYWAIYRYLPRETQGYVPAFIAANYIMTYYCDHNICPMRTQLPEKSDTVVVNRDVHFKQIAGVTGISVDELRALNPQYRQDVVNGVSKPSVIRLPQNYVNVFIDREDSIYNYTANDIQTKRTEVEVADKTPGDQSYSSRRESYSNNRNSHSRRERGTSSRVSKKAKRGKKNRETTKSVTIKEGQTLSEIARKNHTTVTKLKKLNGIKGSQIRAGKKLKVK